MARGQSIDTGKEDIGVSPTHREKRTLSRVSLPAHLVENPPAMWETWVLSPGWEDPLEEGMATHSSILSWRIPWTIQSHKGSDMTEWLSISLSSINRDWLWYHLSQSFLHVYLRNMRRNWKQSRELLWPPAVAPVNLALKLHIYKERCICICFCFP